MLAIAKIACILSDDYVMRVILAYSILNMCEYCLFSVLNEKFFDKNEFKFDCFFLKF